MNYDCGQTLVAIFKCGELVLLVSGTILSFTTIWVIVMKGLDLTPLLGSGLRPKKTTDENFLGIFRVVSECFVVFPDSWNDAMF